MVALTLPVAVAVAVGWTQAQPLVADKKEERDGAVCGENRADRLLDDGPERIFVAPQLPEDEREARPRARDYRVLVVLRRRRTDKDETDKRRQERSAKEGRTQA